MNNKNQSLELALRQDRVKDTLFTIEHPDVTQWTETFYKRAKIPQMFEGVRNLIETPNAKTAIAIGALWTKFSEWVPKLLTEGAANASDNLVRHYLIQVVFEELGGRKSDEIHCDLFSNAIRNVGITSQIVNSTLSLVDFNFFEEHFNLMASAKSNAIILGLNLGLEINAEENIDTLFKSLCHSEEAKLILEKSFFFRIHRVVEEEHIRLNVANFLRFCRSQKDKEVFLQAFDLAIMFWNKFWGEACNLIHEVNTQPLLLAPEEL